ncbi:MAG: antibiotic biosynthesis monooxygenase family protein [Actinomycetota bacterium]
MHGRVTISETPVDKVDLAIKVINEEILPAAKKIPGFKGGYWLGDRASGKGITITLWESEEALKAGEDTAKQLRSEAAKKIGLKIGSIDRYEVLGQA